MRERNTIWKQQHYHIEGDIKVEVEFASWPRKVAGRWIWRKFYKRVLEYNIRDRFVPMGSYWRFVPHMPGWDTIEETVITRQEAEKLLTK